MKIGEKISWGVARNLLINGIAQEVKYYNKCDANHFILKGGRVFETLGSRYGDPMFTEWTFKVTK